MHITIFTLLHILIKHKIGKWYDYWKRNSTMKGSKLSIDNNIALKFKKRNLSPDENAILTKGSWRTLEAWIWNIFDFFTYHITVWYQYKNQAVVRYKVCRRSTINSALQSNIHVLLQEHWDNKNFNLWLRARFSYTYLSSHKECFPYELLCIVRHYNQIL